MKLLSISGAARGLAGIGRQDIANPLRIRVFDQDREISPMQQPVRMWSEIDASNPFDENGELNRTTWTKMNLPGGIDAPS